MTDKMPPLPKTTYVLGVEGDGYGLDKIYSEKAYTEEDMIAYAKEYARIFCPTIVQPRTPLTPAEVRKLWHTFHPNDPMGYDLLMARAVERYHGIID